MIRRFDRLVEAVQTNCHIADARHAGDLTLCTYLLALREFYRWEHGTAFTVQPPRAEIGAWIAEREALWESLADADFLPLPIKGSQFGPFDSTTINEVLAPHGLVYGAGVAHFGKVISKVPVNRIQDATDRLLALYKDKREGEEELGAFFRRVPPSLATEALKDLAQLLPNELGEQDLIDLGENQVFNPEVMDGECSA